MCKERYINPFTDFSFKKPFGDEQSMAVRDYENILESAKRQATREGLEIGLTKGREEGKEEERKENIRFMISVGVTPETIATKYGMTIEEVVQISKS